MQLFEAACVSNLLISKRKKKKKKKRARKFLRVVPRERRKIVLFLTF